MHISLHTKLYIKSAISSINMIFKIFHTTNFPFAFLIYDVISASIGNFEYFLIRFTASINTAILLLNMRWCLKLALTLINTLLLQFIKG